MLYIHGLLFQIKWHNMGLNDISWPKSMTVKIFAADVFPCRVSIPFSKGFISLLVVRQKFTI